MSLNPDTDEETIFHAPFIWIKARIKQMLETLSWNCFMCRNLANGWVDIEELLAYKIQLHVLEWNKSSSADWDPCPTKIKKTISTTILYLCVWHRLLLAKCNWVQVWRMREIWLKLCSLKMNRRNIGPKFS